MNPYKIIALLIALVLIADVYAILYINGFKPTITSKEMKDNVSNIEEIDFNNINNTDLKIFRSSG